ncbi:MAG: hypothetical protein M1825_001101 [Sarcosagium campestre]|nr:MAG: hypothetical protein M1825_001101 [Sarcosagium campestre]
MDKMKFWGSSEQDQSSKNDEEQDLSTLLTREERGQLTTLVAEATECMLQVVKHTFDASERSADINTTDRRLGTLSEETNPNIDRSGLSVEEQEAARKAHEKREKDLSAPRLKKLEGSAIKSFDDWRNTVIARVGEVINTRDTAEIDDAGETKREPLRKPLDKAVEPDLDNENSVDTTLHAIYPPLPSALAKLPKAQRVLILHSMLLLLLSLEHYSAYSRILLLRLTSSLHLSASILAEDETKVAQGLLEAAKHMTGDDEAQKRGDDNKTARRWKVGLATVAGAALIGVTGGLAAPLLAAGIGSVMGGLGLGATAAAGLLGSLAGSGVLVGSLFGAYGGRMTGQMMDAYAKEVQDFAFLPVRGVVSPPGKKDKITTPQDVSSADRRLRVAIGISGWLERDADIVAPWRVIGHNAEVFALRYELEAMMNLGNALSQMVSNAAWSMATSQILKHTVLAGLAAAMWPISFLKIGRVVDNPFSVAKSRSDKAGVVLADALINKAQGERPVTLIGYSLGARLIYACLMELAERHAFGLVESVVLIGAPAPSSASDWRVIRSVVAGRVVNVFSDNDYILGFLYRTSSIQYGVAGLQRVDDVKGVENIDVSTFVSGHLRYRHLVGSILSQIGFEDVELAEVRKEERALKTIDEQEKKEKATEG